MYVMRRGISQAGMAGRPSGLGGIWPSWGEMWKTVIMNLTPITGVPYDIELFKKNLAKFNGNPNVKTPDDLISLATSEYQAGNLSYEQFMAIVQASNDAKKQSSGLVQFVEILKWTAIIAGIGIGAYLLVPPIKRIIGLVPIPEPKKAS